MHIKQTFTKLLDEMPLSEISVKLIVENCGINRKSFYYHYQDIPSLLEEVVTEDTERAIRSCKNLSSLEECLRSITAHILENRRAILHIYRSMSRDSYRHLSQRAVRAVAALADGGAENGYRPVNLPRLLSLRKKC